MVSGRRRPRREISGIGCGRESAQGERVSSRVSLAVATLAGDVADSRDSQHSAPRRQRGLGEAEINAGRVEELGRVKKENVERPTPNAHRPMSTSESSTSGGEL